METEHQLLIKKMSQHQNGFTTDSEKQECPFSKKEHPIENGSNDNEINRFHILDETEGNDDSDNSVDDFDSDVPDDEIDRMLEEALDRKKRKASEAGLDNDDEVPFEEKNKILLIEKGDNKHFTYLIMLASR